MSLVYFPFDQLALDGSAHRACKSTSQRKLESWHAGTIPEVARFIHKGPAEGLLTELQAVDGAELPCEVLAQVELRSSGFFSKFGL